MLVRKQIMQRYDWFREMWDIATPWVQIIGFVILCAFTVGTSWNRFNSMEKSVQSLYGVTDESRERIEKLERNYERIDQKLDDIIDYFHVPRKGQP